MYDNIINCWKNKIIKYNTFVVALVVHEHDGLIYDVHRLHDIIQIVYVNNTNKNDWKKKHSTIHSVI